ncbi:MAG TPA: hypothetical protein VI755_11590 [Anaerolineales bacterium]|nr:hypothetical protein [Anaerolineales bacterium]
MATEAYTNYGSTLTKGGVAVGACMVIDFPEIATGKANTTNHGSGGYAESIPNGLITLGDITLSVIVVDGVLATIRNEMASKTISSVVISDGVESMTFDGYYLSAKKEAADANSPDVSKLTVVIAPTGSLIITP